MPQITPENEPRANSKILIGDHGLDKGHHGKYGKNLSHKKHRAKKAKRSSKRKYKR